ncbi:nuclear transport factor 2 family protein [Apibacter sp. HY039]|uniref:nuclear transport factor 2 family protein n=1 Tax=Apibacter sp. HY039 TaxID=2501476 RepID=UPI000FEB80C2|nr:nuclear transport factor 2 family protein [Apibacter sp. HY039]
MQLNIKNKNIQLEEAIKQSIRQLIHSMVQNDLNTIDKLLDKDFTLTHITGYVQSKSEWLDNMRSEKMKYYSSKETELYLKINYNKAIVLIRNYIDANIGGSRKNWRLQQKFELDNHDTSWIITKSVASLF